jgi:hypothetical protein
MENSSTASAVQEKVRKYGRVTALKILHGFGFIFTPERESIYFKFANLENHIIPNIENVVSFELGKDGKGRPIAIRIRIEDQDRDSPLQGGGR